MSSLYRFIVAGDVKDGVEEWLVKHGAEVDHCMGLTIAQLPHSAEVYREHAAMRWHVTVGFEDSPHLYLNIETAEEDAMETVWELKKD